MGKLEDLEKLQYLKESGAVTDEEFEKEKSIILNRATQNTINEENKKVEKEIKMWQLILVITIVRSYNDRFLVEIL